MYEYGCLFIQLGILTSRVVERRVRSLLFDRQHDHSPFLFVANVAFSRGRACGRLGTLLRLYTLNGSPYASVIRRLQRLVRGCTHNPHLPLPTFLLVVATRYLTIFLISESGMGLSIGNCTAPFEVLNFDSSSLNASIPLGDG